MTIKLYMVTKRDWRVLLVSICTTQKGYQRSTRFTTTTTTFFTRIQGEKGKEVVVVVVIAGNV